MLDFFLVSVSLGFIFKETC